MPFLSRFKFSALLPLVATLICTPAWAAFTGSYAPANWTPVTQAFGCGTSQVDVSAMPNTLTLRTNTACAGIGAGYNLTGTIPVNGTLTFDWTYTGTNAAHTSSYTLAGVTTTLGSGNSPGAGTVSIPVTAGQTFAFTLNGGVSATLGITNFSGPQAVVATPVPTLDTAGLAGLAGLLGLTALWALRRQRRYTNI